MKKSLLLVAAALITLTSCDSVKSMFGGSSMDSKSDLDKAFDQVKEKAKTKTLTKFSIWGNARELKNEMTSMMIDDVNSNNEISTEQIFFSKMKPTYSLSPHDNRESDKQLRIDSAPLKGLDTGKLNADFLLSAAEKAKSQMKEFYPDYKFEVISLIQYELMLPSGETRCQFSLCYTNPKDDTYTEKVYYEITFEVKSDGSVEMIG